MARPLPAASAEQGPCHQPGAGSFRFNGMLGGPSQVWGFSPREDKVGHVRPFHRFCWRQTNSSSPLVRFADMYEFFGRLSVEDL